MMLIIFDKDGTLVRNRYHADRPPNTPQEQEFLPGRLEVCQHLLERDHMLAVASNQGGVAFGHLTFGQAENLVRQAALGIRAASWRMCPYHPEGTVAPYNQDNPCRKPNPGMLQELLYTLSVPGRYAVYVGDRPEDQAAADMAGVGFHWAEDFFDHAYLNY